MYYYSLQTKQDLLQSEAMNFSPAYIKCPVLLQAKRREGGSRNDLVARSAERLLTTESRYVTRLVVSFYEILRGRRSWQS